MHFTAMRMKITSPALLTVSIAFTAFNPSAFADAWLDGNPKLKVQPVVPMVVRSFPLESVRLLDGPFKHAQELDKDYLLSLDVDRLLRNFRVNAGLPTSAQPLGGWEAPDCELRGHFVGHYMSACAMMYASTGDARLKEKGDAVVAGLAQCQAKLGSGYLSAFPESFIERVERRERVWAPYYTLHKIFAGLEDMYIYCGNTQALEVAKKFGDWVIARNSKLTDAQMQAMLGTEQGGMNETLANLYSLTGEKKYLDISLRFNHHAVLDPATQRRDALTGLHANTQIPKFIGAARQYELTATPALRTAAEFFWDAVVSNRSYVIGGNSDGEAFTSPDRLSQMGPNTTETCNTYNMLKLTKHLFCWDPRATFADYYERALYNHILSSQNPDTGMMCYYVPLRSGSHKNYNSPTGDFWCCTGTGVENHSKYGGSIYFHNDQALYVCLFVASELNWADKGLKLRQETSYPDEGASKLVFTCDKPVELTLNLRHPAWAASDFEVRVNGEKPAAASQPGTWVTLKRTWRNGDRVEITMPFTLHTEAFKDNPRRFAFLNGPLVLAAPVDTSRPYPVVVSDRANLLADLKAVAGKPNTFTASAGVFRVPNAARAEVVLEPFYRIYGSQSYVVYFDSFTQAQWDSKQQEYAAELKREKELDARTVDRVNPGEEQNERDHKLQSANSQAGDFNDRKWRHAGDGGWFSYEVKVLPGQALSLVCTYWGSDVGRTFDVLVDGQKIATQKLDNTQPDQFFDVTYPLPASLVHGKEHVTVKFQAQPGSMAGGLFGLRVLKSAQPEPRAVDSVKPGQESSERGHAVKGESTTTGDFMGRTFRHAPNGGWFSYELKTVPDQVLNLVCTYWGSDVGRTFDVLVDGQKVTTQTLENNRPNEFYDETYLIAQRLVGGKDRMTVRFQARPGSTAGGLFGLRLLKADG